MAKKPIDFSNGDKSDMLDFDWLDTNTLIKNDYGELVKAGTCIKLNDYIIFLRGLSITQLNKLRSAVENAIKHELSKRVIDV